MAPPILMFQSMHCWWKKGGVICSLEDYDPYEQIFDKKEQIMLKNDKTKTSKKLDLTRWFVRLDKIKWNKIFSSNFWSKFFNNKLSLWRKKEDVRHYQWDQILGC